MLLTSKLFVFPVQLHNSERHESSGMLHHFDWQIVTRVPNECSASHLLGPAVQEESKLRSRKNNDYVKAVTHIKT
jgi:hypothetical protein